MPTDNINRKTRIFVLALDGATYDLLIPWMSEGHLPNLKQLYESGVHGSLESTYPPLTAPAWSSFMTGKSPANHGLFEFFRRDPGSYQLVLNNRHDIEGRSIWRVLSDSGKNVGVLGVPLTWPPEAVNGFIVTGLLTPRRKDIVFTHPPELGEELHEKLGRYFLQHREKYVQDDPARLIHEEVAILENRFDAVLYLMESKPWDFFMFHILGTDVMQHGYWHNMDPTHPQHTPEGKKRFGTAIRDFYKRLDELLPALFARLPENTYVMVMSDHGFGPLKLYINFNTWLLQKGFIKLKRSVWSQLRYLAFRLGYHYRLAWDIGSKVGLARQIIKLGRGGQERIQRKVFLSLDDVDWPNTTVYSIGNFGQMYVNLQGREPQGCVEPGEHFEQVLTQLETELLAMRDPQTGEQVIAEIWRGPEIWQGTYAHRAPDLFFFTKDMKYKAMGLTDFGSNKVFEDLYGTRAHHHLNGAYMLSGPNIKVDVEVSHSRLIDLAPTIYHLLNVPIPRNLDGRVLSEAFTGDLASREVKYEPHHVDRGLPPEGGYTPEEEAALTEMLRDLGYVS